MLEKNVNETGHQNGLEKTNSSLEESQEDMIRQG